MCEPTTAELRKRFNAVPTRLQGSAVDYVNRLEQELRRIRTYWLCIEGLTVEGFMAGIQCPDCGMGKEHAAAFTPESEKGE